MWTNIFKVLLFSLMFLGNSDPLFAKKKRKKKKSAARTSYAVGSLIGLPLVDAGVTFGYVPKGNKVLTYYLDLHTMRSPFGPGEAFVVSAGMRAFWGSFYIGSGIGSLSQTTYEEVADNESKDGETIETSAREYVTRKAYVVTPHLGNLWRFGSTFTFGVQWLGLDLPIAKAGDYEDPAPVAFHLCRVEIGFSF